MRLRSLAAALAMALVIGACGSDGGTVDPTDSSGAPTTLGSSGGTSATTSTPSGGGSEGSVKVIVAGVTYELVTGEVKIPGSAATFPTSCEPSFFGAFAVLAAIATDEGELAADPQTGLTLIVFPSEEAAAAADSRVISFRLTVRHADGSTEEDLTYASYNDEALEIQDIVFEGDPGSWTIDGNRVYGEVAVYEYDHVREFFTASFDITCPSD